MTSSAPPPRPIPIERPDSGRIVPPNWLEAAPVTRTILALNVAVFVVQVMLAGGASALTRIPHREQLLFGASYPLATVGEGRWETLVTACFLHGGILHIGFNMLALWQAGPLVERAVGSARVAPMYLVAGVVGNLASTLFAVLRGTEMFSVGASGAISGVIAAALVVGWRVQGWKGPLTQAMVRWLAFVLLFGLAVNVTGGNIDNWAHGGGAVAGAGIAAMWRRGVKYGPGATRAVLGLCAAVLVACVALVGYRDRTNRFAGMVLIERAKYVVDALDDGRCRDAYEALRACERLRKPGAVRRAQAPDEEPDLGALRSEVEAQCGRRAPAERP